MALSTLQLTLGGITIGVSCCLLTTRLGCVLGSVASKRAGAGRGVVSTSSTCSNTGAGGEVARVQLTEDAKLGSLWAGVIEVMLAKEALGEDIFLVPGDSRPKEPGSRSSVAPLPAVLRDSVVFAMTAFDPVDPQETRSLEGNTAANEKLWQEIKKISPRPTAVWPTWGYNFEEGWREDGFCMMYDLKDRLPARLAVVDLARRFGQGAIFDYAPSETSGNVALTRTTVPAKSGPEARQVVTVWRTSGIPGGEAAVTSCTYTPPDLG